MKYKERTVQLKNSKTCILRSPGVEDAEAMLNYLRRVSEETHYMTRYPEEAPSLEGEVAFLGNYEKKEVRSMMINAIVDGKIAGNLGLNAEGEMIKLRHRASIGLAVTKEYWGMGLGTLLLETALEEARKMGYSQVELGVYADNARAISLYERLGFERWGKIRNAFRLKDGTMLDEILMGKIL